MGQCSHGNGSVIGRHTSKLVAGHKDGSCAQLRGPQRSGQTSRTSANDYEIHQALPVMRVQVMEVVFPVILLMELSFSACAANVKRYQHFSIHDFYGVRGDPKVRSARKTSGGNVKFHSMHGTSDGGAAELAQSQRAAGVRTGIGNRADGSVHVEDRDFFFRNSEPCA